MTDETLSSSQRSLLQRWFDGDARDAEHRDVEALLDASPAARRYADALKHLRGAVRSAFDAVDARRDPRDPEAIVEAAASAPTLEALPLEELAPALERFYDGEVTGPEANVLRRLREQRDDVDAYLNALESLGEQVRRADRAALERADLDAMWTDLEGELERIGQQQGGTGETPPYDSSRHDELLHRYADGEASPGERQRVEAWLEAGNEAVASKLQSMQEMSSAVRGAFEHASAGVDFEAWGDELEASLDAERNTSKEADEHDEVVPLDKVRDPSRDEAGDASRDSEGNGGATDGRGSVVSLLFSPYGGVAGAVAAVFVALATAVVVYNAPTISNGGSADGGDSVVIVDKVTHGTGTSVVVDGPKEEESTPSTDDQASKPTVIWLLDDRDESAGEGSESSGSSGEESDASTYR